MSRSATTPRWRRSPASSRMSPRRPSADQSPSDRPTRGCVPRAGKGPMSCDSGGSTLAAGAPFSRRSDHGCNHRAAAHSGRNGRIGARGSRGRVGGRGGRAARRGPRCGPRLGGGVRREPGRHPGASMGRRAVGDGSQGARCSRSRSAHVRGSPAAVLLDRATDADLLVVGSRGRSGLRGVLLGSVGHQCIHHSPCPVTVVRNGPAVPTNRIVVGVDGSDGSYAALLWAAEEAGRRQATLSVVLAWNAWDPLLPLDAATGEAEDPAGDEEIEESAVRVANEMTERALAETGIRPVHIETIVLETSPRLALVDLSQRADLLVVGSRGQGGFKELLLGSVSHYSVQHAACAVTVVPSGL